MTNREYIEIMGHLPREMAVWLQPYFSIDAYRVPIEICQIVEYGREWRALAGAKGVKIDADHWKGMNTNELLQLLAHEFVHVEAARKGPLKSLLDWCLTIFKSRRAGGVYEHRFSNEEQRAEAMRQRWFAENWPRHSEWENLLKNDYRS